MTGPRDRCGVPDIRTASISPTPLLMILAEQDATAPPDVARALFEQAAEPMRVLTYDGGYWTRDETL